MNRKNGANFYSENFALEMCIIHNTFYASQDEFSFEVVFYLILWRTTLILFWQQSVILSQREPNFCLFSEKSEHWKVLSVYIQFLFLCKFLIFLQLMLPCWVHESKGSCTCTILRCVATGSTDFIVVVRNKVHSKVKRNGFWKQS